MYCEATAAWIENGAGNIGAVGSNGVWVEGACAAASERICGYQIRMDYTGGLNDDTAVNDLKFFCCDGYPGL